MPPAAYDRRRRAARRRRHARPAGRAPPPRAALFHLREGENLRDADYGPYEPWARPHVTQSQGLKREARAALRRLGAPPHGLLYELLWCLTAHAARTVSDGRTLERARTALTPAANEVAAGSGVIALGPVAKFV